MPSGPKKRRAARRNRNKNGGYDEDDHVEPTSTKVQDGLAVKAAVPDVELAKAVDDLSSKGVVLDQNDVGSKDGFGSVSKGKEEHEEVPDSRPEENNEKLVDEKVIIEPTSIEVEDVLAVKTADPAVELAKAVDDLSSKGAVLFQNDVGSKDGVESVSKGKEVSEKVLDSSLEENNDKPVDEKNVIIEPTSTEVEDILDVKTADPDVELAKAVDDDLSSKGVVLVQNDVGSKDGLESVSEGKEVREKVLDSSPEENNDKPVDESVIIELASIEVADKLASEAASAADVDEKLSVPDDVVSSRGVFLVQDEGFKDVLELEPKENDGKEVNEDVLDSSLEEEHDDGKQLKAEIHDSEGPGLKGPKKRRAARRNRNKNGGTTDSQLEEDDHIEPTSTEIHGGSAMKTADPDVELAKAVDDDFSSKGVILIQNDIGSKDGLESVSKANEVSEKVLDSSLEENNDKPADENAILEPTSIEVEDRVASEAASATDVDEKISLPGDDVVLSRGVFLVQDEGFKDVLELESKENDGKEVNKDVLGSSLEEDDGKESQAEVPDSGPVLKGTKKRRAAKKKTNVSPHNETDSQVEENSFIEPTSVKAEDGLGVNTAAADVESGEPVDALSIKRVILVQDVVPKDVFELGLKGNDGKDVYEDVLESRLEKNEWKEPPAEITDSGPKENEEKPVKEVSLIEPSYKSLDGSAMTTATDVDWADAVDALSEGDAVVQEVGSEDGFEVDLKGDDGKEVIKDVLDLSLERDEGKELPPYEVNDRGPKENDDNLVEENVLIEANSTKLEDSSSVTTEAADVKSDKPVDEPPSTKEVALVQDRDCEDVFQLGLEENEGKEVIDNVLDSILERVEEADGLATKTIAAADFEVPEQGNYLSSLGIGLVHGVDFEDALDLGLRKYDREKVTDRKKVTENALDMSLEEDDGKQPHEVLDSGPALKGRKKKRRAAKKKTGVSSHTETDSQVEKENAFTEPTSINVDDGLVVKAVAAAVELGEPVDTVSTKEVILVQDAGPEDVSEMGLRANEGKEDVNGSGAKENEDKPIEDVALIESSCIKLEDNLPITTAADVEWADAVDTLSEGVVAVRDVGSEDGFEVGLKGNDGNKVIQEVLDLSLEEDEGKESPWKSNDSGPMENDDKLVEENVLIEAKSTELEDNLAVTTADSDIELAKPVDEPSSKGVALVQDIGSENVFQLGLKENDGKEVIEDVLDSSLEKVEGIKPSMEVNNSGASENHEKAVEEDALIDATSVEPKDGLAMKSAADVESDELVDPISTTGVVLVRDIGSENILELGSREYEGKDVNDDVNDSSLEEDDGKETPAGDLGPGSVSKGPKKRRARRAAKKKTKVRSHNETDSQAEENASIKPTSIKEQDGLVGETAAADVELEEPVDAISTKGVILVQDAGSEDVLELGLRENDGKEVNIDKDEWNEQSVELNGSGSKENEDEPGEEVSLIEPSNTKLEDGSAMTSAANVELDEPDNTLSEWVVVADNVGSEDDFEVGSKGNDRKEVIQDVLDLGHDEDEGKQSPCEVNNSGPKVYDDNLVEEDLLTAANSTKLADSLAETTAADDVKLDEPSPKGVSLVRDIGSEDVFQLGSNENDGKEDIEDVLDSNLEKLEAKEPPMEVNDSGPKENHEKPVEEDAVTDLTPIELEDNSAVKSTADVELAKPVDAISSKEEVLSREVVPEDILELGSKESEGKELIQDFISSRGIDLFQDVGSEDVLELGPKENDGKEVNADALNTTLKEDDGKQPPTEVLDSDLVLKGPKKRRAAKKKTNVSSQNETDSQGPKKRRAAKKKTKVSSQNETDSQGPTENYDNLVEENVLIEVKSVELEEGLAVTSAAANIESGKPVDEASSKGISLAHVQDKGTGDVFQLDLKENDGKDAIEGVLYLSLEKVEGKEEPLEVNGLGPVGEDGFIDPTPTPIKPEDGLAVATAADDGLAEPVDAGSVDDALMKDYLSMKIDEALILKIADDIASLDESDGIGNDDVLQLGLKENDGKEVTEDVLDSSLEKVEGKEQPMEVNDLGLVEEDALIDPTPIKPEDGLAVTTAADDGLAEQVNVVSSKGVVLVRDVDPEDILDFSLKENEGKGVIEDVTDLNSEEDDGNETPAEALGQGSILKVVFSKYCFTLLCIVVLLVVSKQQSVPLLSTCSTGSSWSRFLSPIGTDPWGEHALTEYHAMEIDEARVIKFADDVASLAESADNLPSKGVVLDLGSEDDCGLDSQENKRGDLLEGNELTDEVLDSDLKENGGKEPALEVHDLGPKEYDDIPIVKDPLTDELHLASAIGEAPLDSRDVVVSPDSMEDYSAFSKEAVNDLELGSMTTDKTEMPEDKELTEELLDCSTINAKEQAAEGLHSGSNNNDSKPVVEDPLTDELELATDPKETEGKELASNIGGDYSDSPSAVDSMEDDSFLSKEVVQNAFELDSKRKDEEDLLEGNELGEELLDSGPKQNAREPAGEVIHSGPEENDSKPVLDDPLTDELEFTSDSKETEGKEVASILGGDSSDSPSVVESADLVEDVSVSTEEVVQNVPELGSKKTDVLELLEASEPAKKVLDRGPIENVDKPEVEGLSAGPLELESDYNVAEGKETDSDFGGDPLDSAAGVVTPDQMEHDSIILSREVAQKNVFELGYVSSDGEDFFDLERNKPSEKVLEKSAVKDLWTEELELESDSKETGEKELASEEVVHNAYIEPVEEVLDSGPKEEDDKRVVEDLSVDELELTSDSKEIEMKGPAYVVASDDSETVVQNPLLEGKPAKQNLGVVGDDLMTLIKEVRETIQEQLIVVEDMRVNLRQMLDKVNLIRTAVQG